MTERNITVQYAGGYGSKEVSIPGPFDSLAAVKSANACIGHHYFDRSTIQFFNSKPARSIIAGRFFIDSTQFIPSSGIPNPRKYKIVVVSDAGECDHVHLLDVPNSEFDSLTEARQAARELVR